MVIHPSKLYSNYYMCSPLLQEEYTTQLVLLTEQHQEKRNDFVPSNIHHCSPTLEQPQVDDLEATTGIGSIAKNAQSIS